MNICVGGGVNMDGANKSNEMQAELIAKAVFGRNHFESRKNQSIVRLNAKYPNTRHPVALVFNGVDRSGQPIVQMNFRTSKDRQKFLGMLDIENPGLRHGWNQVDPVAENGFTFGLQVPCLNLLNKPEKRKIFLKVARQFGPRKEVGNHLHKVASTVGCTTKFSATEFVKPVGYLYKVALLTASTPDQTSVYQFDFPTKGEALDFINRHPGLKVKCFEAGYNGSHLVQYEAELLLDHFQQFSRREHQYNPGQSERLPGSHSGASVTSSDCQSLAVGLGCTHAVNSQLGTVYHGQPGSGVSISERMVHSGKIQVRVYQFDFSSRHAATKFANHMGLSQSGGFKLTRASQKSKRWSVQVSACHVDEKRHAFISAAQAVLTKLKLLKPESQSAVGRHSQADSLSHAAAQSLSAEEVTVKAALASGCLLPDSNPGYAETSFYNKSRDRQVFFRRPDSVHPAVVQFNFMSQDDAKSFHHVHGEIAQCGVESAHGRFSHQVQLSFNQLESHLERFSAFEMKRSEMQALWWTPLSRQLDVSFKS